MKIGIIGASGKVGQLVLKEALDRGHQVTAIVRNASKITITSMITVLYNNSCMGPASPSACVSAFLTKHGS